MENYIIVQSIGREVWVGTDCYRVVEASYQEAPGMGPALTSDPRIAFTSGFRKTIVVQKAKGSLPVPSSKQVQWETVADLHEQYNSKDGIRKLVNDENSLTFLDSGKKDLVKRILRESL